MYYCEHKRKVKMGEAWERGYCILSFGPSPHINLRLHTKVNYMQFCFIPSSEQNDLSLVQVNV